MAFGLSDRGEELLLGLALGVRDPPAELVVGLYDEASDSLVDSDVDDVGQSLLSQTFANVRVRDALRVVPFLLVEAFASRRASST